ALVKPDGTTICHSYENYPPQYPFTTYGIAQDGSIGYLKEPTAGTMVSNRWSGMVNSTAYQGVVPPVTLNKSHGYYDQAFTVELTCSDPQAQIQYTTDGSDPRVAGTIYNGPVTVSTTTCLRAAAFRTDYLSPNVTTASYIFPQDVVRQTRPVDSRYTLEWGEGSVGDYDMENDATHIKLVAGNTSYTQDQARSIIENALLALPALSIATAPENLFDASFGIYNHSMQSGIEWERPASAELFDSITNEQFHIDCGLRVQGGASREPLKSPKHSLSLRFNGGYGNSTLEHKLFDQTDNTTFNSIQLRACFNNSWVHYDATQRSRGMLIRDQFIRECLLDMGNPDAGAGRYVHLYLNGLYWGVYMLHERAEASHYAAYHGGEPEYYDALNGGEVNDGTYSKWQDLGTLLQGAVGSNQSTWETITERLDINNYIDWTIIQRYGGNEDLKTDGNWKVAGGGLFNAPWRYYAWDSERTMEKGTAFADTQLKTWPFLDTYLARFTEFKVQFADRLYQHIKGPLSTAATQNRWQKFRDMLDTAIIAESARWGDHRRATPYTRNDEWLTENTRVLGYISSLTSNIIVHFQGLGWYPNISPPTLNINTQPSSGGIINSGDILSINNPNGFGTIYYTTDQTDPRQYWTGLAVGSIYSSPVQLSRNTIIKARIRNGSTWSALQQVTYQIGDAASGLRISELMYHPTDDGVEFVELTNIGSEPISLYQLYFDQGITFTFPDIMINSGEYVVITDNISLFTQTYPDFTGILAGEFTGSLSNSGETLTLKDISGIIIQQFSYSDKWYNITDGDGFSLSIIDALQPTDSWNYPDNWRPGNTPGGSPGFDDTGDIPAPGSIIINEILAHSHAEASDWIELYNTTETPINIGGWLLSDSSSDLAKYEILAGTVLQPYSYLVLYQDQTFGNINAPGCNLAFALSENGETLYLSSALNGNLSGYYQQEEFGASLTGESFGKYMLSDGQYDFVTLSSITPGSVNATAKTGPLVISEIMYAPLQTAGDNFDKEEYEYIRISNITATDVTLSELVQEAGKNVSWKISEGIDYTFPVGMIIPAGQSVIIARNPGAFIQKYSAGSAELLGPYSGKLNNSGERVSLVRPGEYENNIQYYIVVDSIEYSDETPWPAAADGTGPALKRINNSAYGNDHSNWQAQLPL
ncbi:MAG: lamin tail domain-containing protein, partial [Sedimentisphaerales bacterium]|nr:lamin tail domain-containing protein [Sedimentisphaerales bacterium]